MLFRTHLVYSLDPPLMFPGLSVRVAAFVIDFTVLLALDVAVIAVIGLPVGLIGGIDIQGVALIELALWLGLRWLYFALWESSPYCATPGAMACHLKVVDAGDGEPPTFSQASIRLGAKLLSAVPLFAGWLPIFFEPRRRALHDLLSGCLVIRFEPQVVVDAVLEDYPEEVARLARQRRELPDEEVVPPVPSVVGSPPAAAVPPVALNPAVKPAPPGAVKRSVKSAVKPAPPAALKRPVRSPEKPAAGPAVQPAPPAESKPAVKSAASAPAERAVSSQRARPAAGGARRSSM